MVLSEIMQRFVDHRPVAIMVRAVLERQFSEDFFDIAFSEVAQSQYTRELHARLWYSCRAWRDYPRGAGASMKKLRQPCTAAVLYISLTGLNADGSIRTPVAH